jgi:large subunit ribosomal protein L15
MKLHELRPAPGSRRSRKRIGRGISAGQGKTSGRGQKGAGAREGAKTPRGFEGGQMKMTMRLPKLRGFTNRWRAEYTAINVSKLNRFPSAAIVDGAALAQVGLVTRPGERVKLLAAGKLKVALTVRVQRASAAAIRAVEAAGGRLELLETRPAKAEPAAPGDAGTTANTGDEGEAEPEG